MKQRIIITESERNKILSKHIDVGYKTLVSEQVTNYTIQDLQNKLNQAPFNAGLVADNKFGPKTAQAIMNALDNVKSGNVSASLGTTTNAGVTTDSGTTTNSGTTTDSGKTTNTGATTDSGTTVNNVVNAPGNQGAVDNSGVQSDGKDSMHTD